MEFCKKPVENNTTQTENNQPKMTLKQNRHCNGRCLLLTHAGLELFEKRSIVGYLVLKRFQALMKNCGLYLVESLKPVKF